MITIVSLWLPILLSAVIAFIASSIIHMLLPYHRNDFVKVPEEEKVMDDLREYKISPGDYVLPYAGSSKEMASPEYKEKTNKGPVAFLTVIKSGPQSMGKSLSLWFLFLIVVGIFSAYITSRALDPGAHYLAVFRFAGATAFIAHVTALWNNTIWYGRSWKSSLKNTFDGLVYALLTAGVFGWLWPA